METKTCTKCLITKDVEMFALNKRYVGGRGHWCKACKNQYNNNWRKKNKGKASESTRKWRKANPEKAKEVQDLTNAKNRESRNKKRREKRKDAMFIEVDREYRSRPEVKQRRSERQRERLRDNPELRILQAHRNRINRVVSNKHVSSLELLGCTSEEMKRHLEDQFEEGMSWDNHGFYGWHIDHISPCASFDLTDPAQQRVCFHYTNLQPLWAKDNLAKGDTWEEVA